MLPAIRVTAGEAVPLATVVPLTVTEAAASAVVGVTVIVFELLTIVVA